VRGRGALCVCALCAEGVRCVRVRCALCVNVRGRGALCVCALCVNVEGVWLG